MSVVFRTVTVFFLLTSSGAWQSVMLLPLLLCASLIPNGISENFISLKDHDFMGDDQKLMSLLAQRMALFETEVSPINMDPEPITSPTQIELIQAFHRINETGIKNLSARKRFDFIKMVNGSKVVFEPEPRFVPPANPKLTEILGGNYIREIVSKNRTNGTAVRAVPDLPFGSEWDVNWRMVDAMEQHIYMVQRRLEDIDLTIQKYESDVRFRIAYIFNRLADWLKDIRTIHFAMTRDRDPAFRVKKQLYYYEHALRKNIDITYTVEFLNYLQATYMEKIKTLVPQVAKENKKLMKDKMKGNLSLLHDKDYNE